uniref:Protein CUSTOS n=1 Tax=Musca domestica TaxID=7370 RepID=A0A1I8NDX5_MUSDO
MSSSDSEDEEQMKMFLEASDTTFLNNDMFKDKTEKETKDDSAANESITKKEEDKPKSQRYLADEEDATGTDFNLPESMQKHMAKKFHDILKQTYEFCEVNNAIGEKKSKAKSRVRLLNGFEDYVKPYEEFEYETKGPTRKPEIKRRCIENNSPDDECLKQLAISGNDILSGKETKSWAKKKERKDKVFHYRLGANDICHAKEVINEFTPIRRKNHWSENKIKDFKIVKSYL